MIAQCAHSVPRRASQPYGLRSVDRTFGDRVEIGRRPTGHLHHEVKRVVVIKRYVAIVEIEKDDDRQPRQLLVPVNGRVIQTVGVQKRRRLQIDALVGIFTEGARTRPRCRGVEEPDIAHGPDPKRPHDAKQIFEIEILGLAHARRSRSSPSPHLAASRLVLSATRAVCRPRL
jgi:hypothetical protein